jgi:hypothetical protein
MVKAAASATAAVTAAVVAAAEVEATTPAAEAAAAYRPAVAAAPMVAVPAMIGRGLARLVRAWSAAGLCQAVTVGGAQAWEGFPALAQ